MSKEKNLENNGYLHIPNFIKEGNFDAICKDLNENINNKINKINLKKIGGYKIGNLNLYAGKYGSKLWFR